MVRTTARSWMMCGLLFGAGASLACCAAYANYPPIGDDWAVNDPNTPPIPSTVTSALIAAIDLHPVEGPYVINPPQGTDLVIAQEILAGIGDPDAQLVTPEAASLPGYHVTRIWVRDKKADVDVVCPIAKSADATTLTQTATIRVERKHGRWVVIGIREWPMNTEKPALYGWE